MHCVMHKCILVKVGGDKIHVKYVKTRQLYEIRGEFCKSKGKRKISRNKGGKRIETGEIEGKFEICGQ